MRKERETGKIFESISASAQCYTRALCRPRSCKGVDLSSLELLTGHRYESDDLLVTTKLLEICKLVKGSLLHEKKKMQSGIGEFNRFIKLKEIQDQLSAG